MKRPSWLLLLQKSPMKTAETHEKNKKGHYFQRKKKWIWSVHWISYEKFWTQVMVFLERCKQAKTTEEDMYRVLSMKLTEYGRQCYLNFLKEKKLGFVEIEFATKTIFITSSSTRALIRE